jgi:hypothetical protein
VGYSGAKSGYVTGLLLEPHFTVAAPGLAVSTHFLFLLDGGGFAEGFNLVVA